MEGSLSNPPLETLLGIIEVIKARLAVKSFRAAFRFTPIANLGVIWTPASDAAGNIFDMYFNRIVLDLNSYQKSKIPQSYWEPPLLTISFVAKCFYSYTTPTFETVPGGRCG